ncbi:hypothetical protein [Actinomadura terrae]|uniref:hypothetical protein n=1 Tax=Actinomadura terrae TaxID=604353 RepID=UPI001FA7E1F8|nr:hypothetical protein [Actinomadura terrae]
MRLKTATLALGTSAFALASVVALGGQANADVRASAQPAAARFQTQQTQPDHRVRVLPGWYLTPLAYKSGKYAKGQAIAHGPYNVARVDVWTDLARKRFYGWQQLDTDHSGGRNTRRVASVSRKKCGGTYTYRVRARATAVHKGKTYRAAASDQRRFRC